MVGNSISLEKSTTPAIATRLLGFAGPGEEQRLMLTGVVEKLLNKKRLLDTNSTLTVVLRRVSASRR